MFCNVNLYMNWKSEQGIKDCRKCLAPKTNVTVTVFSAYFNKNIKTLKNATKKFPYELIFFMFIKRYSNNKNFRYINYKSKGCEKCIPKLLWSNALCLWYKSAIQIVQPLKEDIGNNSPPHLSHWSKNNNTQLPAVLTWLCFYK